MAEERVYMIPLRKARKAPRRRRARMAAKLIEKFLKRHMKSSKIKIERELNDKIWKHSAENPPSRVPVRAIKRDDGTVEALYGA